MTRTMRKLVAATSMLACTFAIAPSAYSADAYPTHPIKLIVPFTPGGGVDAMARLLSDALTAKFGWNIVVENRPGAGGTVGMGVLARAEADGYTMAIGQTSNLSINPSLYKDITYNVAKDFTPIASVASQPMVLCVLADKPYKTVAEFIAYGKANPGKLSISNAGRGTVGDITGRYFAKEAGLEILHVPYKGASPAMTDLLGGQVDAMFASAPTALPQLKNPKIRMLAISTTDSIPQFPNVPPLSDTLPGFESASLTGILVPSGSPQSAVDALSSHIIEVIKSKELQAKISEQGNVAVVGSAQDYAKTVKADSAKWSKIIKENNLQIN